MRAISGVLLLLLSAAVANAADKESFRVELPLKKARSRDPVLGGSRDKIFVNLWIPDSVKVVRGAVCNPFSKDEPVSAHWRSACRLWQFAFVQVDFDGVGKQEFGLLTTALVELAKKSGHPEVEHLPLCFTGMSRGGGMSMNLSELLPERTLASVPVCLEVGPASEATRRIPVMTIFGEKDGGQMQKLLDKLPTERRQEARWGVAVQWGRRHEFGQANNLSFVFLDDVIARRLPKEPSRDKPTVLGAFPVEDGWIGDPTSWSKDGPRPTIQPLRGFKGDPAKVCWLPSQRVAAVWQAFGVASKDVVIAKPAGLGDGQKFVLHAAGKPVEVQLSLGDKLKPSKVELWDAHQRLAERTEKPWTFEAALQPGIHSLIAVVYEAGQTVRTSRPHTIVVAASTE